MLHGMYISLTFINLFCVALECSGGGQVETGGGATDLPHTAPHVHRFPHVLVFTLKGIIINAEVEKIE